jgi:hypothetical protein
MLALDGVDVSHMFIFCFLYLASSATLFRQRHSKCNIAFVLRAGCSISMALVLLHKAVCGRHWLGEECETAFDGDVRFPSRMIVFLKVIHKMANAGSLTIQFWSPSAHIIDRHGHDQLWYRSIIRCIGIPLSLVGGCLKLGVLGGTEFERGGMEIAVDFLRGLVIIPLSAWSLRDQWEEPGIGIKEEEGGDVETLGTQLKVVTDPVESVGEMMAVKDSLRDSAI